MTSSSIGSLVQHWQPRSLILDGLCQNTDLCLIITMLIIIGICWLFWPRSNFAIAVLQVTNLGKTFLKKGRGISVLRFAQLWDCVSVLRFTQCLGIYSVFEIVSALIRYFLSFEIASVLILSQFWNCLSFEYSYRIAVLDLKSIFSLVASTQIFRASPDCYDFFPKHKSSDKWAHIFSEFYQISLKDQHLEKIITISWLLLSNSDDNGYDNNAQT